MEDIKGGSVIERFEIQDLSVTLKKKKLLMIVTTCKNLNITVKHKDVPCLKYIYIYFFLNAMLFSKHQLQISRPGGPQFNWYKDEPGLAGRF